MQAGVDAYRGGWIAVVLDRGLFAAAIVANRFTELTAQLEGADVIAVDIPIGTGDAYPRAADVAARKYVGRRRSSVFLTPPRPLLEAPSYSVARQLAR
ncbi:MAG: DUF429 domain-containing protein, partial [Acidimicrobiia bacterium]